MPGGAHGRAIAAGLLLCLAVAALYRGWQLHWFLTDDAYIAFRFISNRRLGFGYTWNPPPFVPVEGYSSFSWVVLLDGLWSFSGFEPPDIANNVSLMMAMGTLGLTAWATWRLCQVHGVTRGWPWLLACVLLATVTHRSFLVWSSSGLETALFNLLFQAWILFGLVGAMDTSARAARWLAIECALASAVALTRPDGLLLAAASALMPCAIALARVLSWRRALLRAWPLLAVAAHLAFRWLSYGELVPNTYYAKVVRAWPAAGLRYAASFALEYAYYLALPLWIFGFVSSARSGYQKLRASSSGAPSTALAAFLARALVLASVLGKLLFDLLIAGGDHFEYRTLSFLVPLLALAFAHGGLTMRPRLGFVSAAMLVFVGVSAVLPWTYFAQTDARYGWPTRPSLQPIAEHVPALLRPIALGFDSLQAWLIPHGVGIRHHEHRAFWLHQLQDFPPRAVGTQACATSDHPVAALASIGVAGWVLSECAIVDLRGLTDRVIARAPASAGEPNYLGHDRKPPLDYVRSFKVNVFVHLGRIAIYPRPSPLTGADIRDIEQRHGH